MYFKDYLNSIAHCLEAKLNGYKQQQHPGDKGDLCEFFIKDFLHDSFIGNLKVFMGGHIIDAKNNKSEQIDIVLCAQNSIKIFNDKGLYPIKTIFGVVNIKKELTHTNLFSNNPKDCGAIKNLRSIPKDNINLHTGILNKNIVPQEFKKIFPYKVIFSYEGKILPEWEDELNFLAEQEEILDTLPDLIVINKQGMIKKCPDGKAILNNGEVVEKFFYFTKFEENKAYHAPFIHILNELHKRTGWQYFISPEYEKYFNQDLN